MSTSTNVNPFANLQRVYPVDQLPLLRSVRPRQSVDEEKKQHDKKIVVAVITVPPGAFVYYGKKKLGPAPLEVEADENRTPLDLTIRNKGYMTLRTRIYRDKKRKYIFKLTPARF